ncbi:MAG: hypothetical protein OEU90_03285, partial [Gammaproteobacteria bacterium]|nr:hypothetical protein [Gammaproteobacteria bacterium]
MTTTNKTIPAFVLGAVVGVAIAYFGLNNPPGANVTGTIAPAERYRTDQAGSDDIQLGNQELQEVMQTDVFATLVADEAFRNAMNSESFRSAMNSEALRMALNSEEFRTALNSEAFRGAMNSEAFRGAMNSEAFRGAMASEEFRGALSDEA